jgi:hypothetical protein
MLLLCYHTVATADVIPHLFVAFHVDAVVIQAVVVVIIPLQILLLLPMSLYCHTVATAVVALLLLLFKLL